MNMSQAYLHCLKAKATQSYTVASIKEQTHKHQ